MFFFVSCPARSCSFFLLAASIAMSGCAASGSSDKRDATSVLDEMTPPAGWASPIMSTNLQSAPGVQSAPVPLRTGVGWAGQFGSERLLTLISEALSANFSLTSVAARYAAVAETVVIARSAGRPLFDLSVGGGGQLLSFPDAATGSPTQEWRQLFDGSLNATWEADLWGRISARTGAAIADLIASEADLNAARLSVKASVASNWIRLSNALAQRDVAREQLRVRSRSLELTERRFASGLSSALDVRLARSAEASARADIANTERTVSELGRLVETLLGRYPSGAIEDPEYLHVLPAMAVSGDPISTLSRRPDIAAAEARLEAAGLRTKAARAALRPSLRLNASFGSSQQEIGEFLNIANIAGRLLASLSAPLYRGGALRADARAAEERAKAVAADYAQSVLDAWREVENAREAEGWLAHAAAALFDAREEAKAAEELAERQYQSGLISIFNLLDAQTQRLSSERSLNATRAARALNRVSYHLALGGDADDSAFRPSAEPDREKRE